MMDYRFKNSTLLNSNAKPNNNNPSKNLLRLYIYSFNYYKLVWALGCILSSIHDYGHQCACIHCIEYSS